MQELVAAVGLGILDGMNPCMMLVFLSLAGYSISISKNFSKLSIAFISVCYLVYLLALWGILGAMMALEYLVEVKYALISIVLILGGLTLKEGLAPGALIKLGIPESAKPRISRLISRADLTGACLLAGLASFYELPCSLGLPLAYIRLLWESGITGPARLGLLAFYNTMYIMPLVILASMIWLGAKLSKLESWRMGSRRYLRISSGCILLGLGCWIWFR